MHSKEHLAALVPAGAALVLNTIRWATEIRALDELKLPATGKTAAGLKPVELKMAAQPIRDMTGPWAAQVHTDKFSAAIQALVSKKEAAGQTGTVTLLEETPSEVGSGNVLELTQLPAASLTKRKPGNAATPGTAPSAATVRKLATKPPLLATRSMDSGFANNKKRWNQPAELSRRLCGHCSGILGHRPCLTGRHRQDFLSRWHRALDDRPTQCHLLP